MARRGAVTSRFKRHDAKVFISLLASDHIVSLYTNYVHLVFETSLEIIYRLIFKISTQGENYTLYTNLHVIEIFLTYMFFYYFYILKMIFNY